MTSITGAWSVVHFFWQTYIMITLENGDESTKISHKTDQYLISNFIQSWPFTQG